MTITTFNQIHDPQYQEFLKYKASKEKSGITLRGCIKGAQSLINACAIKPIRILANTACTALPSKYEVFLAGTALNYGKEALQTNGPKCIALSALHGLFGDVSNKSWGEIFTDSLGAAAKAVTGETMTRRYTTYWTKANWSDFISSDYWTRIGQGIGRVAERAITVAPAAPDSSIIRDTWGFVLDSFTTLFTDPTKYAQDTLGNFQAAACGATSFDVKVAAASLALLVIIASLRIGYTVPKSLFSEIREKYFSPSIPKQELTADLEKRIQAIEADLKEIQESRLEITEINSDDGVEDCEEEYEDTDIEDEGIDPDDESVFSPEDLKALVKSLQTKE